MEALKQKHQMIKIYCIFILLCLYSCQRTCKNKFIMNGAEIEFYSLVPDSLDKKHPDMDYVIRDNIRTFKDNEIYFAILTIHKVFVSDFSDSCDVPFRGMDRRLDVLNGFGFQIDSDTINTKHYKVQVDKISDINKLLKRKSGKILNSQYIFPYVDTFFTFKGIVEIYNSPDTDFNKTYSVDQVAFPMLFTKKQAEELFNNKKNMYFITDRKKIPINLGGNVSN